MSIFQKEPAVIIGILASCVLAVIGVLQGEAIISEDLAATLGNLLDPEGGLLVPIVVAVITRFFVFSPAKAAELEAKVPEGYVKA